MLVLIHFNYSNVQISKYAFLIGTFVLIRT